MFIPLKADLHPAGKPGICQMKQTDRALMAEEFFAFFCQKTDTDTALDHLHLQFPLPEMNSLRVTGMIPLIFQDSTSNVTSSERLP